MTVGGGVGRRSAAGAIGVVLKVGNKENKAPKPGGNPIYLTLKMKSSASPRKIDDVLLKSISGGITLRRLKVLQGLA